MSFHEIIVIIETTPLLNLAFVKNNIETAEALK